MNINVASQNQGVLGFAGAAAASPPVDIRQHNNFGFTFHVKTLIAVEAVFKIQSAPPSDADPCLPGPFVEVPEVLTCMSNFGAQGAAQSTIHIPVGTPAG